MLDKLQSILTYLRTKGINTIAGFATAFVMALETGFGIVGDLLGVINDNIGRIKNLFDRKS